MKTFDYKLNNYNIFKDILDKTSFQASGVIEDTGEVCNFIQNIWKDFKKHEDDILYKFLSENGYKIDTPYNDTQLLAIKEELARKDLFLDTISFTSFDKNKDGDTVAHHYVMPFFNKISNPISEETRKYIAERLKNKDAKNK